MGLFKSKSENEKDIKMLSDSLSKIEIEIEELKKKTTDIEEYKSYAERMSKENAELKQNEEKITQAKWPLYFSMGIGLSFCVFSAICIWFLFFSTTSIYVTVHDSIPMLIVGAIIYFVMAVILVLFAYQIRHIFNRNEKTQQKK